MDSATLAMFTRLFEENAALRKENDELKAKYVTVKVKKVKEVDPNKPKKKYGKLDEETLAAVRRENGLRVAAWKKSQKLMESEEVSEEVPEKKVEDPLTMEGADLIKNWNLFMSLRK
jgi:regulator of replication initiation timing